MDLTVKKVTHKRWAIMIGNQVWATFKDAAEAHLIVTRTRRKGPMWIK